MIFISNTRDERFMYKLVARYLKGTIETFELELLYGLDNRIITAEYGLKVFTGFEAMPADLIKRVGHASIEELVTALDLPFMQAKKAKLHIISGYPFSFLILIRIYVAFYPHDELIKYKSLRPLFRRLNFIEME